MKVLVVDKAGTPRNWEDVQTGACYYARDKVLAEFGSPIKTFIGGKNEHGEISEITVSSIISVSGPIFGKEFYERETIYTDRDILYARDGYLCGYCGNEFKYNQLTIDHIHPQSRGGLNTWMNTVAACKPCNVRKGNKTPEEAGMPLIFVPYAPSVFDKMILSEKVILADQMDFLMARASRNFKARKRQFN